MASITIILLLTCLLVNVLHAIRLDPVIENTVGLEPGGRLIVTCSQKEELAPGDYLEWTDGFTGRPMGISMRSSVYQESKKDTSRSKKIVTSDRSQPLKRRLFLMGTDQQKLQPATHTCVHKDKAGREKARIPLRVVIYDKVQYVKPWTVKAVNGDQMATLDCQVMMDPDFQTVSMAWVRNEEQILEDRANPKYEVVKVNDHHLKLIIRPVTKEDEGTYECRVFPSSNYYSSAVSQTFTLAVQYAPMFLPNTRNIVWVGRERKRQGKINVNITCLVDADPPAQFEWLQKTVDPRNPVRDHPLDRNIRVYGGQNMETIGVSLRSRKLYNGVGDDHYEEFTCKARNPIGKVAMSFRVRQGTPPFPPKLLSFNVENGALLMEIEETGIMPPLDYYKIITESNHTITFNASDTKFDMKRNSNQPKRVRYHVNLSDQELPMVKEKATLMAHNPLGFSEGTVETIEKPITLFMIGSAADLVGKLQIVNIMLALVFSFVLIN